MTRRVSITALLLAAFLLAGCAAQPVSQAGIESSAASGSPPPAASEPASPDVSSSPGAPLSSASAPTPTPVPATAPPPKPGNPTFALVIGASSTAETYEITWTSPDNVADAFLVYGLPECLRDTKAYDGQPCVVPGMKIPAAHLVLLATAPGDARSVQVSWPTSAVGRPPYSAILMRATNSAGKSIFTIVHSENVCSGCTY